MSLFTHKKQTQTPVKNQEWLVDFIHAVKSGQVKVTVRDNFPDHLEVLDDTKVQYQQPIDGWSADDFSLIAYIAGFTKGGEITLTIAEGKVTAVYSVRKVFPPIDK